MPQSGNLSALTALSPESVVLVFSNAPDELLAKRIAHHVVEEGLVACANLGAPSLSMYMWQGQLEGANEVPMTFKTTVRRVEALIERITELHPYEVPEVLVVPVVAGLDTYVRWVQDETAATPTSED
ncbi:divalent-cation tolerance protein CutA [Paenalcaligenes niemegkensis]|uniref:divalent-cation tolerance protein CutA n=1 Tax=Paenalcaligenes niemegkensis TaxID=2895469 RepID=UPI001EE82EA7|nr:divalent-cation tolerance protein CutA [Paenalcaligenes niemegkensis]MCQ9617772.1 divalent-cation tolerance protein CutA [Paenalcaligenes niemegkensis]